MVVEGAVVVVVMLVVVVVVVVVVEVVVVAACGLSNLGQVWGPFTLDLGALIRSKTGPEDFLLSAGPGSFLSLNVYSDHVACSYIMPLVRKRHRR